MKLNIQKIKRELGLRGWNQKDLAKKLGITEAAVSLIFKRKSTNLERVSQLGEALGEDPKNLLI